MAESGRSNVTNPKKRDILRHFETSRAVSGGNEWTCGLPHRMPPLRRRLKRESAQAQGAAQLCRQRDLSHCALRCDRCDVRIIHRRGTENTPEDQVIKNLRRELYADPPLQVAQPTRVNCPRFLRGLPSGLSLRVEDRVSVVNHGFFGLSPFHVAAQARFSSGSGRRKRVRPERWPTVRTSSLASSGLGTWAVKPAAIIFWRSSSRT